MIWIQQHTKYKRKEESVFIGISRNGGVLVGAVILFLFEHKKHNSGLSLSPTLTVSPSVDIVFIVSLINVIIMFLNHYKCLFSNLNVTY